MREIKFRAFDTKLGVYCKDYLEIYDNLPADSEWDELYERDEWYNAQWTLHANFHNERILFEQYTGLKDNNGVEIYEGDIVSTSYISLGKDVIEFTSTIEKAFCAYGFSLDNQWIYLGNYGRPMEVIGNIHEEAK